MRSFNQYNEGCVYYTLTDLPETSTGVSQLQSEVAEMLVYLPCKMMSFQVLLISSTR